MAEASTAVKPRLTRLAIISIVEGEGLGRMLRRFFTISLTMASGLAFAGCKPASARQGGSMSPGAKAVGSKDLQSQVVEGAAKAVAMAAKRPDSKLDYSIASLAIVEAMLDEAAKSREALSAADIHSLTQDFGSYVLEVGRKAFGGRYYWHEASNAPVLVVGEPASHIALVAQTHVAGRLNGDEADNIPFFFDGFAQRVRHGTPGDSALFF